MFIHQRIFITLQVLSLVLINVVAFFPFSVNFYIGELTPAAFCRGGVNFFAATRKRLKNVLYKFKYLLPCQLCMFKECLLLLYLSCTYQAPHVRAGTRT